MNKKFKSINETLKNIIKQYSLEESYTENLIINEWQNIINKRLKDIAKPYKLEKQTLYLKTKSEAWVKELNNNKKELIEMINDQIKPYEILDINFI
jgi:predicted nucleic acid-binding Zn ribbon protein